MNKKYNSLKIFFFIITNLWAQSQNEISNAKKLFKQSGMSKGQAIELARDKGYSQEKINNVINENRNKDLKSNDKTILEKTVQEENPKKKTVLDDQKKNIDDSLEENNIEFNESTSKNPLSDVTPYFGYNIFKNDPALFQSSSLGAADPNYLVGPNDEIILMLWGETQFRQVLKVNKEGFVFIPEIGQVFVNGLSLSLLESKLFRVLSQSYSSLSPPGRDPTTFLDVSLGNIRPLRIQVLGEVNQPGAYTVNPSTSLFSSLYYFNGPKTIGSLRGIKLIRAEKEIAEIDFYDFLLMGKKINDQKLQLDDIVYIPIRKNTVHIKGEVYRPGIYETKPGEDLLDLIKIAGGLKTTAYLDIAQIDRIVPFNKRKDIDRTLQDINLKDMLKSKKTFEIFDGDIISISSISNIMQNTVSVNGAVERAGYYEVGDSLRIRSLISKAGGVTGDAYLDRIDITRIKPDLKEELLKVNLSKTLNNDLKHNILLKPGDKVFIYKTTDLVSEKYVSISGHVKKPGRFLLQKNMNVYDLLLKSGSFLDQEFKKGTYLERADLFRMNKSRTNRSVVSFNLKNILENGDSESFLLEPDDQIIVYPSSIYSRFPQVELLGRVVNPGFYELNEGFTIENLLLKAGGLDKSVRNPIIEITRINPAHLNYKDSIGSYIAELDNSFKIKKIIKSSIPEIKKTGILQDLDIIYIRENNRKLINKKVFIDGAVSFPGHYSILHYEEKLLDILNRSGGLLPNAYPFGSSFRRNGEVIDLDFTKVLKNKKSNQNIKILAQDSIYIEEHFNMIYILGEVNSPGTYQYIPGLRISDLIKNAGGLTKYAEKKDIYIKHPNGKSRKYTRFFNNIKVYDNSVVYVGKEEEEEPFDLNEYLKEITGIVADITQAISLYIIASK